MDSLTWIFPVEGVVFSNELIEASPVHVTEMTPEALKERLNDNASSSRGNEGDLQDSFPV